MLLNVNLTDVDSERPTIEPGVHDLLITKIDYVPPTDKYGSALNLTLKLADAEEGDRRQLNHRIFDVTGDNLWFLKRLLIAVGKSEVANSSDGIDTDELLLGVFKASVGSRTSTDEVTG